MWENWVILFLYAEASKAAQGGWNFDFWIVGWRQWEVCHGQGCQGRELFEDVVPPKKNIVFSFSFFASGLAKPVTSQRVVGCPDGTLYSAAWWGRCEDAGSIGVWEDVFCINGKGVSSLQSERAQKRNNNENQRTSITYYGCSTAISYCYELCLFLLTSAHFCWWYVSEGTAFQSKT